MKNRISHYIQALFYFFIFTLVAIPVWADDASGKWVPPGNWFIYFVIFIVLFGSLVSILIIRSSLSNTTWSLSNALSEGIELTEMDEDGKPIMDASNKPLMVTKLYASSSRMVALMGMIVILLMFLAFGSFSLFAFAKTGEMPKSINEVVKFLIAGLTLFAPYAVNKFSKLFEGLGPKR
jgi:uncharacterized membrane protein